MSAVRAVHILVGRSVRIEREGRGGVCREAGRGERHPHIPIIRARDRGPFRALCRPFTHTSTDPSRQGDPARAVCILHAQAESARSRPNDRRRAPPRARTRASARTPPRGTRLVLQLRRRVRVPRRCAMVRLGPAAGRRSERVTFCPAPLARAVKRLLRGDGPVPLRGSPPILLVTNSLHPMIRE
jgi:hypothetical protein